jgi:hypothetical protein
MRSSAPLRCGRSHGTTSRRAARPCCSASRSRIEARRVGRAAKASVETAAPPRTGSRRRATRPAAHRCLGTKVRRPEVGDLSGYRGCKARSPSDRQGISARMRVPAQAGSRRPDARRVPRRDRRSPRKKGAVRGLASTSELRDAGAKRVDGLAGLLQSRLRDRRTAGERPYRSARTRAALWAAQGAAPS